ncbi:hypothetical protein L2E82_27649 [Cichorium intybus]|uniref:Uncharacterized protein n=1 Tax=Cichorium intybus TaxID=13427 RepID=A0ACB9CTP1_CICIN|nr:hypothetical protein L2E82_27649 [Cichorium intybus]
MMRSVLVVILDAILYYPCCNLILTLLQSESKVWLRDVAAMRFFLGLTFALFFSKIKTKKQKSKLSPLLGSTARLKLETISTSGISRTKLHTAFEFTGQPASGFQYLSVAGTGVPFL